MPETGRESLSQKPLLPLAGSGKAYDPQTGEWRPAETFATSPESLPPRRFTRLPVGDLTIERVFAPDYKAATLSVDEVTVAAGARLSVAAVPSLPRCDELLLFVRPEQQATIAHAGASHSITSDTAMWLPASDIDDLAVVAPQGAAYVVIAYAGKPNE